MGCGFMMNVVRFGSPNPSWPHWGPIVMPTHAAEHISSEVNLKLWPKWWLRAPHPFHEFLSKRNRPNMSFHHPFSLHNKTRHVARISWKPTASWTFIIFIPNVPGNSYLDHQDRQAALVREGFICTTGVPKPEVRKPLWFIWLTTSPNPCNFHCVLLMLGQ